MKYNIEGQIDFFSELYKSLDEVDKTDETYKLINKKKRPKPLKEVNYVRLKCILNREL